MRQDSLVRETLAFHHWLETHRLSRRAALKGAAGAGLLATASGSRLTALTAAAQEGGATSNTLVVAWDQVPDNLDPQTADLVFETLTKLVQATELAAVIATHNLALAGRMTRRVTLQEGKVVELA